MMTTSLEAYTEAIIAKSQEGNEPVYVVGKGWQVDEMPPVGTKLYTHPQPNERKLQAYPKLSEFFPNNPKISET